MRGPATGVNKKRGVEGPPFVRIFGKGAVGQNQPVQYCLGDLREWLRTNTATTSHQAALNAGLYGFVTNSLPFVAEGGELKRNDRDILIAGAWSFNDANRRAI